MAALRFPSDHLDKDGSLGILQISSSVYWNLKANVLWLLGGCGCRGLFWKRSQHGRVGHGGGRLCRRERVLSRLWILQSLEHRSRSDCVGRIGGNLQKLLQLGLFGMWVALS